MVHLLYLPDSCCKHCKAASEAESYRDVVDGVAGVVLHHAARAHPEVGPRRLRPPVVEVAVLVILRAYTCHQKQTTSVKKTYCSILFLKINRFRRPFNLISDKVCQLRQWRRLVLTAKCEFAH